MKSRSLHHFCITGIIFLLAQVFALGQIKEFKITLHKSIYVSKWIGYIPSYVVLRHNGTTFTEGFAYYPNYNLTNPQGDIGEKQNFNNDVFDVSGLSLSGSSLSGNVSFLVRRIDGSSPTLLKVGLNSVINGDHISGTYKGSFGNKYVIGNTEGKVYTGTVNLMQPGSVTMMLENGMPGKYEDHLVIDVDFDGGVVKRVIPDAWRYSPTHLGLTPVPNFKIIDTIMGIDGIKHKALFSPDPIRIVLDSHTLHIVGDSILGRICFGYYTNINGEPLSDFRGNFKTQVRARIFGRQVFGTADALENDNDMDVPNVKISGLAHNYTTAPTMPSFSPLTPAPFKSGTTFNPPYFNPISQDEWMNHLSAGAWWLHQAPEAAMAYNEHFADYISPTAKQYDNNGENVYGISIGALSASKLLTDPSIKNSALAAASIGAYSFGTHATGIYGLHNYYKNMFWTSFYRGLAFLELYEATKNPVWFEHSILFADMLNEVHQVTQVYCPNCDGAYTYFDDENGSVGSPNTPASEPLNYPRPAGEALYIFGKLRHDYGVTTYEKTEEALLTWHLNHMTTEPEFFKYRAGFGVDNTPSSGSATYLLLYLAEVAKPGSFTKDHIDTLVKRMEAMYADYSHTSSSPRMSPSFTSHEHRHINGPLIDMAVASPNASAKVALAYTYLFEKYADSTYLKKARELALFGLNTQNVNGLLHHLSQTMVLNDSTRITDTDKHSYLNQKAEAVHYLYKTYRQLLKHEMIPGAIYANFTISDEKPLTTTAITFNAASSKGSGLSYAWDFGDGTTASGVAPVKTYTNAGNYIVRLTITAGSKTDYIEKGITVIPGQYLYRLEIDTADKVVLPGSTVQFVSTCYDQNLTPITTPTITWEVRGTGNTISPTGLATLNGVAKSYSPYKVICKAVLDTATIIDSVSIYIVNQMPDTNGYRYLEYGAWLVKGVYNYNKIDYPGEEATQINEIVWRSNSVSYPQAPVGTTSGLDMSFTTRGDVASGKKLFDLNPTSGSGTFRLTWSGREADGYNSVILDLSKALTIIPDTLHFYGPVTNKLESVWHLMKGSTDGITWDTLGYFEYVFNNKTRIDFPLKTVHPKIETVGSAVIAPGESVNFTSIKSIGALLATNVTWNFGDGTPLVLGGVTQSHTYASAGDYWAKLSMTRRGKTFTDSILIKVTTDTIIGRIEITNPLHNIILINDSLQFNANVYDRDGNLIASPTQPKGWHVFGPFPFTYGPWGAHVGFYCLSDSGIGTINRTTGMYKPFPRDSVYYPEDIVVTIRQGSNVFRDTVYAYSVNRPRNTNGGYRYLRLGFGNIGSKVVRPIEVEWIDTNNIRYPEFAMHPDLGYFGRFGLRQYSFVSGHVREVDVQYDKVFTGSGAEYRAEPNPHPSSVLDLGQGRTYGPDSLRMLFVSGSGEAAYMVAMGSNNAVDWDTLKYIPNFKAADTTVKLFTPAQTPAEITVQPSNQVVCEGDPLSISVTTKGSSPEYKWYKNGVLISGATTNVFSKNPATLSDTGSYKVVVSNTFATVTSNTVTVKVNQPVTESFTVKLCNSETYEFGASTLDTSDAGLHTQTLLSAAGCDSTVYLTLQKGKYRLSAGGKMRGTYYVAPTGAECPFKTLQSAIDALELYGVDSAVVIRVNPKTYNEQLKIDSIKGASATNKITIAGLIADPDSATVVYSPSAAAQNYVLALNGVDYVEVKDLTIQNASAGGAFACTAGELTNKTLFGDGGTTRTSANPFKTVRDSRMFISKSELDAQAGTGPFGIGSLAFESGSGTGAGITGTIYMKHVTDAEWTTTSNNIANCASCKNEDDWELVATFSNITIPVGSWGNIPFDNIFSWNGVDHLVVKICVSSLTTGCDLKCESLGTLYYYGTTSAACGSGGTFVSSARQMKVRIGVCTTATALRSVVELQGNMRGVSMTNTKVKTPTALEYLSASELITDRGASLRGFTLQNSTLTGGSKQVAITSVGGADSGVVIKGNNLSGFSQSGIDVTGGESFNIDANVAVTAIDSSVGISLTNVTGTLAKPFLLSNNAMAHTATTSDSATGLLITGGSNIGVYYNSINHLGGGATGAAAKVWNVTGGSKVHVVNNIFVNKDGGFAIFADNALGLDSCNYNDLYSDGNVGKYNSTVAATLANWQAASGKDANSISTDPMFVSATDLHLSVPGLVVDKATPVYWVQHDVDGEARNPDLGFDEFGTPLSSKLVALNTNCDGHIVVRYSLADVKSGTKIRLERSFDREQFVTVDERTQFESARLLKLSYIDKDVSEAYRYYRVVEEDADGGVYFSYSVSAICGTQQGNKVMVYPNPSGNQFNIRFSGAGWGSTDIVVLSMDGKEIYRANEPLTDGGEWLIDASSWNSGVYVLRVTNREGTTENVKLIRW